jgi:pilus assembly protein CpaD
MTGPAQMEFARMNRRPVADSDHAWHPARRCRHLLIAVAAGALLAGCTHVQTARIDRHVIVGSVPEDYRTTHPIAIEEGVETLDVPVGLNTVRLTEGMRGNIGGFAQGFLDSGSSAIAIVTPFGSTDQAVAHGLAGEIRAELVAAGIRASAIELRSYRAAPSEATAPIRLAYSRIGAHTAGCGPWPDQFSQTSENRNYFNYGCASQQNLAAIVANPTDLLYPRAMAPEDATRRTGMIRNYEGVAGGATPTPTQSDFSKEPSAAIAQGVGSP